MNDLTIPVVTVAAELGVSPDQLVARLGDAMLVDGVGFRCVERHVAAALIDEHQAAARAAAERAQRRAAEHKARLVELNARYPLRGGVPAVSGNAFADMLEADR